MIINVLNNLIKIHYIASFTNYVRSKNPIRHNAIPIERYNSSISINLLYSFLHSIDLYSVNVNYITYHINFLLTGIKYLSQYNFNDVLKHKNIFDKLLDLFKIDVEEYNRNKSKRSLISSYELKNLEYIRKKKKLLCDSSIDNFGLGIALLLGSLSNKIDDLDNIILLSYRYARLLTVNYLKILVTITISIFSFLLRYKVEKDKWLLFLINLLSQGKIDKLLDKYIDNKDDYSKIKTKYLLMWLKFQNIREVNKFTGISFMSLDIIKDCFITSFEYGEKDNIYYYGWSCDQLIILSYLYLLESLDYNWLSLITNTCLVNQDILNISMITGYWFFSLNNLDINIKVEFMIKNKYIDFIYIDKYQKIFKKFELNYKFN